MDKKIIIGIFGFLLVFFSFAGYMAYRQTTEQEARRATGNLLQLRNAHKTKLTKTGAAPQEFDNACPPEARLVKYRTPNGDLKAFLFVPKSKGKHRALLFAHGGFALGADDFSILRPFLDSNWVVMAPAVRGENGNPGNFELCFGEVDDLKAAVSYLQALPSVDKGQIFAFGHSVGGTNVALLAECDDRLKKVAACGAYPDLGRGGFYSEFIPYDPKGDDEHELRSFGRWISNLKCPLLLCYGGNDKVEHEYYVQALEAQKSGKARGKQVTIETLPGSDHFSALEASLRKVIPFFDYAN